NLYDNSIIVIMGDHDGISANHNKAMAEFLEKDSIDAYDYQQLQRVPFFVHIPGSGDGEIKESIAGQVDIKPTLLHLAGIIRIMISILEMIYFMTIVKDS